MRDDPDMLVPLTNVGSPLEAEMLAGSLRDEGIRAQIFGVPTTVLQYGCAASQISVSVPRGELARAVEILQQLRSSQGDLEQPPTVTPDSAFPDDLLCPKCGYSLVGLRMKSNCPECGREISARQRAMVGTNAGDVRTAEAAIGAGRTERRRAAVRWIGALSIMLLLSLSAATPIVVWISSSNRALGTGAAMAIGVLLVMIWRAKKQPGRHG